MLFGESTLLVNVFVFSDKYFLNIDHFWILTVMIFNYDFLAWSKNINSMIFFNHFVASKVPS